jgi:multidrug transporter EmrE-like cation transporter
MRLPFNKPHAVEVIGIGLAALILAVFARHALHVEAGYAIFSLIGVAVTGVGLWMMFREIR